MASSAHAERVGAARLLEEDRDLARGLDPRVLDSAQSASLVPVFRLSRGTLSDPLALEPAHGSLGLLVLEGLMSRDLAIGTSAVATEFLGAGDVIQPWTHHAGSLDSVPTEAEWRVLATARVALLDRSFVQRMAAHPEVIASLFERSIERARSLAFLLALRKLIRVDQRLLLALWHLADRWGRVRPEGTLIDMPGLTHVVLARLISAERPSVTSAIGQLRQEERLQRTAEGFWLLLGQPPTEMRSFRRREQLVRAASG